MPKEKIAAHLVNADGTHTSKGEESVNGELEDQKVIDEATQNAVLEKSQFQTVDSPTHHKMTHASDNFFPQNSGKEKRETGKESMSSLPDKANSQLQKLSIKDMELKKIAQSPSVQSRQGSSNGEIPDPTKSQEAEFDKEIKEQIGARSNSVVEYADPPGLLPEEQERRSVHQVHKEDSDSDDENAASDRKEETMRMNQESLKRQSLASSLGQYG